MNLESLYVTFSSRMVFRYQRTTLWLIKSFTLVTLCFINVFAILYTTSNLGGVSDGGRSDRWTSVWLIVSIMFILVDMLCVQVVVALLRFYLLPYLLQPTFLAIKVCLYTCIYACMLYILIYITFIYILLFYSYILICNIYMYMYICVYVLEYIKQITLLKTLDTMCNDLFRPPPSTSTTSTSTTRDGENDKTRGKGGKEAGGKGGGRKEGRNTKTQLPPVLPLLLLLPQRRLPQLRPSDS